MKGFFGSVGEIGLQDEQIRHTTFSRAVVTKLLCVVVMGRRAG
jgi:hypothetical protein